MTAALDLDDDLDDAGPLSAAKALDVSRERERIAAMLDATDSAHAKRMAERLRQCGSHRLGLLRMGEGAEVAGARSLPLGCRLRICPACSAMRRARFDRTLRPQLLELDALGHQLVFCTFTCRTVADDQARLGEVMRERIDAFSAMRRGRERWQRWQAMVAGGVYGVEVTLYARDPRTDAIRTGPDGKRQRRFHAHVHTVLALQPGVDAEVACDVLRSWWIAECRERGWRVAKRGQDVQVVERSRIEHGERDPTAYVVKYIGKPGDLVEARDALDLQAGCKGLRQVNTLGLLHGAALRSASEGARQLRLPLQLDKGVVPHQRAWMQAEAAGDAALLLERDADDDQAQPARRAARHALWERDVRLRQLELEQASAWREQAAPQGAAADAAASKRRQAALAAAQRGVARRAAIEERAQARVEAALDRSTAVQERLAARLDAARARRERAEAHAERTAARCALAPPSGAAARAAVLRVRRAQVVERERWRVVVADDVAAAVRDQAVRDEAVLAAHRFANLHRVEQRAARLAQEAAFTSSAALRRFQRCRVLDRRAALVREVRRRTNGSRMRAVALPSASAEHAAMLDELRRAAELASTATEARRRAPMCLQVLERAAAAGDTNAQAWLAGIVAGDDQRRQSAAERAAQRHRARRGQDGDMRSVRADLRAPERAEGAQPALPGLGRRAG